MKKRKLPVLLLVACIAACTGQVPQQDEAAQELIPRIKTESLPDESAAAGAGENDTSVEPSVYLGNDKVVNIPPARPQLRLQGDLVSLDFEQAPVAEVVHSVLGDVLGVDYVIDHPLQGEITLRTNTPIPRDQLLATLESILQANGITMVVDHNGRFFISASDNTRRLLPEFDSDTGSRVGFRHVIVPLKYISASGMAEILGPVAPESAFVRVDNARNLLVLAGTQNQLDGWLSIVSSFDIDQLQGMSVGIFPLEHAPVEEVNAALLHMLSQGAEGGQGAAGQDLSNVVRVMPLERLNSIIVVTPRAHYIQQVSSWIKRLDLPQNVGGEGTLFVYEVQNGTATHMAEMLSSIFGGGGGGARTSGKRARDSGVAPGLDAISTGSSSGKSGGMSSGSFKAPDTGSGDATGGSYDIGDDIRIVADEYNNALLIYAPPREYGKIEAALKRLDVAANQVLIEASIIEVTLTDDLEFGVEWFIENGLANNNEGAALLDLNGSAGIGAKIPGFSYTVTNGSGTVRAVINALAKKGDVKVISTPSVMVLDNHTAAIHVGRQQPIQSGSTVTEGGNTISSIEYKDTGVQLEVTPSVNAGGLVTMDILQSVTDVGEIDAATEQRSFLQRTVSSRVAIRSGEAVVLGGLIQDNRARGKSGVPWLMDIPVIGNLFSTTSNIGARTELLVFITPKVARSEQDLRDISREMRARMRGLGEFKDLPQGTTSGSGSSAPAVPAAAR